MAKSKFDKLDKKGMAKILNSSEVQARVTEAGKAVAKNCNATANGKPIPVDARPYKTTLKDGNQRAAVVVTMKHPAAARVEAKRAPLARAAAAAGYTVKGGHS